MQEREVSIGREMNLNNRRVLGARAVLRQRPYARPAKNNPSGTRNPTFAAVTAEAWRAAVAKLRSFRQWYRRAYERYRSGDRQVEFPPGTWALVRYGPARAAAT